MCDVHCHVEPLTRLCPTDIELIFRWLHQIVRTIVNLVVKFRIRSVHPFVHSEGVQVRPIRRIQAAAAVVLRIGIMVCDSLPAEIIVRTLYPSWNLLRAAVIHAVVKWFARIMIGLMSSKSYGAKTTNQNKP